MKIQAINTYNPIKKLSFSKKVDNPVSTKLGSDVFIREIEVIKELPARIKNSRKFDISTFNKLSNEEIEITRDKVFSSTKKAATESIFVGNLFKNYLDETYGKDKYIFACIGTSPSGIGRVLEFSGVETKYFPISNFSSDAYLTRGYLEQEKKGVAKYVSFLKKQGISPKEVKKSDKDILFFDYGVSKRTLRNFEALVRENAKIDSSRKVKFIDINDVFIDIHKRYNLDEENASRLLDYIKKYITLSEISDYTGIPHLVVADFKDMDKIIKNYQKEEAKLFNFCIIDELKNQGKLKENSKNKKSI